MPWQTEILRLLYQVRLNSFASHAAFGHQFLSAKATRTGSFGAPAFVMLCPAPMPLALPCLRLSYVRFGEASYLYIRSTLLAGGPGPIGPGPWALSVNFACTKFSEVPKIPDFVR